MDTIFQLACQHPYIATAVAACTTVFYGWYIYAEIRDTTACNRRMRHYVESGYR